MRNYNGHVEIKNPARVHQFINFEGMAFDGCMPTDIDAFLEYRGNYILFEYKYAGKDMPTGQRLALEHTVNDLQKARRNAVAFLCDHDVRDPAEDIKGADAVVRAVYWNGKWYRGTGKTAKEMTQRFLGFAGALGT